MMRVFTNEERKGLIFLIALFGFTLAFELIVYWEFRSQLDKENLTEDLRVYKPLRPFDPNSIELEEIIDMGIPANFGVGLIRWREYGKVYRVVEDLMLVGGVTDSLYAVIKPYVIIADEFAAKPTWERPSSKENTQRSSQSKTTHKQSQYRSSEIVAESFVLDTVSVEYMTRWGFSRRQAEVLLNYRDAIGGIRNEEQLRRCYVVDDDMADRLLKYVVFVESPSVHSRNDRVDSATPQIVEHHVS